MMTCLLVLGAGAVGCCLGVVVGACCAAARAPGPLVGRAARHPLPDVEVRPLRYDRTRFIYTAQEEEESHE